MTQDVRQWLAEIKSLQQKLSEALQERDEAYASAANWRSLYETEAQQRRAETRLSQQEISDLKAELEQLRSSAPGSADLTADEAVLSSVQAEVEQLQTAEQLREQLLQALIERDRLSKALKSEKTKHANTRKSLTIALGDTVDMLAKERAAREDKAEAERDADDAEGEPGTQSASSAGFRTPLPELPLLNQVQFPA